MRKKKSRRQQEQTQAPGEGFRHGVKEEEQQEKYSKEEEDQEKYSKVELTCE